MATHLIWINNIEIIESVDLGVLSIWINITRVVESVDLGVSSVWINNTASNLVGYLSMS